MRRLGCIVFVATVVGVLAPAASAQDRLYISLGDSLATGTQPDAAGDDGPTSTGYVDDVLAALGSGVSGVRLGCDGGTTASLIAGPPCAAGYPGGSPLEQAEQLIRSHPGETALVTVDIGDNDVERCLARGRVNDACVRAGMAAVAQRLPAIAARLRAATGAGVPVVGLVDYDQFLAYWLRGGAARTFALRSVAVVERLNALMSAVYRAHGVRVADAGARFKTTDMTHTSALSGRGRVPTAVERVCLWTWACSARPVGFDDHPNATGYRVIADAVLAALRR